MTVLLELLLIKYLTPSNGCSSNTNHLNRTTKSLTKNAGIMNKNTR